jgi:uncharacterized protein (DUF427 family)
MSDHYAIIRPAARPYRVLLGDELLVETTDVLEVEEHFGERSFVVPYFSESALEALTLTPTETATHCPLKGQASWASLRGVVDGVWFYPEPSESVAAIAGYFGFDSDKFSIVQGSRGT